MANPLLRRYAQTAFAANTVTDVTPAVAANRAIAGRAIVCNVTGAATTFDLYVAGVLVANDVPLSPGDGPYVEPGLTLLAGEKVTASTPTANSIAVTVCGEEVDNV